MRPTSSTNVVTATVAELSGVLRAFSTEAPVATKLMVEAAVEETVLVASPQDLVSSWENTVVSRQ